MAKNETITEPTDYPVTLEMFLAEIAQSKVELKAGFTSLCKKEGIGGLKRREEWDSLFVLFRKKPTSITWTAWVNKGGK